MIRSDGQRPGSHRVLHDGVMRQFLGSQASGQFADAVAAFILAPMILMRDTDNVDPRSLLIALGTVAGPYAIIGPLSGVVADRWNRRRMLGIAHVGRAAATVLGIVAVHFDHTILALACAGALVALARLVLNLRAASLPDVAPPGRLVDAEAAVLVTGMVSALSGAALVTALGGRSPAMLMTLASAGQLVAAIGFVTLPVGLLGAGRRGPASGERVTHRVLRLVASSPTRRAVATTSTHRCLLGATFVTFVLLAARDVATDAYVLALAVTGVGTFLGTITAPLAWRRLGGRAVDVLSFGLPAIALVTATRADWLPAAGLAVWLSFMAFQNLRVGTDATVQAAIAGDTRARVFSIYDAAYNLSYLAGAALAIALGASEAPHAALAAIGGIYAVAAALTASTLRHRQPPTLTPRTPNAKTHT